MQGRVKGHHRRASADLAMPMEHYPWVVRPQQASTAGNFERDWAPPHTTNVGPWQIVGRLGTGRCTEVFLAQPRRFSSSRGQERSSAAYALKMLRPEWESALTARARLAREAAVARDLVHPHLVPVLAEHLASPPYYLVMPRLPGRTLEQEFITAERDDYGKLARRPCPIALALSFVRQTAQALEALHAAGWAHGDIKPANIMVAPHGHATLIDLEFAYRPGESSVCDQPAAFGTAYYLAPELITSAYAADIRGDIYSLGVTLYELLCGRRPFEAATAGELLREHKEVRPPEIRTRSPWVPSEVADLVRRMLAKDPLRRPQTPGELVRELVRLEIGALDGVCHCSACL